MPGVDPFRPALETLSLRSNCRSNRVFADHDDIVDRGCRHRNRLIEQPWRIMSIGTPDWAHRI